MIEAWVLFPALLLGLATGAGLLVERVAGRHIPGALLPAIGFSLIVVGCQFLTMAEWSAGLIVPFALLMGVSGFVLGGRDLLGRLELWPTVAALAAFGALAAPIVLSGEATFAGYIKLDDTATWMALTDRVMEAGRSLDGLDPSTYEATLHFNLGEGYPIGAFLLLGIGSALSGQDVAWTIQPYMAALGTLVALGLWQMSGSLLESRPLRAVAAFVGSQAALLYGYYLWGGIKEIAAAALLATVVPLAILAVERQGQWRALAPLALACAALVGVLSGGGVVWFAAPLAGALALLVVRVGAVGALGGAVWCSGLLAVLSAPVLMAGGLVPPTAAPLTSPEATGNLIEPLGLEQVAGIWLGGDFRLGPEHASVTYLLIVLAGTATLSVLAYAWRKRAWTLPVYAAGTLGACLVVYAFGSPWVDGKALAIASPVIPFAAAVGSALLFARGLRAQGAALLALVLGGVLASNVLQYRDVNLAPRDQLAELQRAGEMIGDAGPSLLTEYQPYGARHFLRDADPEAAAELRRRPVGLSNGETLPKGESADTDRFDLSALLTYRTLVLRRSPSQSRPPSPFELRWRGEFYEVWQRPRRGFAPVIRHLGLGDSTSPVARPSCADVRELSRLATSGRMLTAASRPGSEAVRLARGHRATVEVPRTGAYEIWLRGSVRPRAELWVDGRAQGTVRHQLNNRGNYVKLGAVSLAEGPHQVEVRFDVDWRPGSGGIATPAGPLVLSPTDVAESRLLEVRSREAERRLCGRQWDWIELVGA